MPYIVPENLEVPGVYKLFLTYRHFHAQLLPAVHAIGIPCLSPALLFLVPIYCWHSSQGHSVGCGWVWPFLSPTAVSSAEPAGSAGACSCGPQTWWHRGISTDI